jgi:hypothetical protein
MSTLIKKYHLFLLFMFFHFANAGSVWAQKAMSIPTPTPAPVAATSSNIRSGLSVGVGWPYVGLKYFFNNDFGTELRFSTAEGIDVYAVRGYWSFARSGNFSLVTGLEAGYVTFSSALNANNTMMVSGNGYEVSPFCGVDYFLNRQFSFLFDFSMPIIGLTSRNVTLGDLQWVINGGLYFYPF